MKKRYTEQQYKRWIAKYMSGWIAEYMSIFHVDLQTAKEMLDADLITIYNELYGD